MPCSKCERPAIARDMCAAHYREWAATEEAMNRRDYLRREVWKYAGVYCVGTDEYAEVKIGYSSDLGARMRAMEVGSPYPLRVFALWLLPVRLAQILEAACHRKLVDLGFHVRGEWFDVPKEVASEFIRKVADGVPMELLAPVEALEAAVEASPGPDGAETHRRFCEMCGLALDSEISRLHL